MLNVFYGRESVDKEKFIFDRVKGRTVLLVPDQYTLEAEREAFRLLGRQTLMDVEVLSPSRLGSRILEKLGGSKRSFVDKYGRHMMLYRSACRQRENLQVFRGMEKKAPFLDSVNNFISEMKQYGCGPEELLAVAQGCEADSYTQKKLMDVYLLFSDYEKQIEGKYTDSEDYANLYIGRIGEYEPIRESAVWVYGFDSFAPKTMAMLMQLACFAGELNVVMTCGFGGRDEELFALPSMLIERMKNEAEKLGVAFSAAAIPADYETREKAPAVKHVERELYALPCRKSDNAEGLTLVEAAGIYNEAESAASYVLHLVRDKGLRYRDIKVILNDTEQRAAAVTRIFQEYGIEIFSDVKRNILSHGLVQAFISLLDVVIEKYRFDCVFNFIKSGFGDLSADDAGSLENYAIKYKIKGGMWTKPFRRGAGEYGEEGLAAIEELRRRAIEPLAPLTKIFKAATVGEFIKDFYGFLLNDLRLEDKASEMAQKQQDEGLSEMAEETAQVWNSIVSVLEQMYAIMGEEPFDGGDFRDIFTAGLSQVEIGLLPPTEDGLMMGTVQRSRSGRIKALLVLGANEGILPQEKPGEGLFSQEERELFNRSGRELCKVDSVRLMEEKLAIYRNLSAPEEYLWMSCSLADQNGEQMRPSSVFLKMKELFPGLEAEKDAVNAEQPLKLINSGVSGFRHMAEKLRDTGEGKEAGDEWIQALAWFKENRPQQTEDLGRWLRFTNEQEPIGSRAAEALFKKNMEGALTLSPSRLEKFANCPFSHLVSYGLRPEERRIFEADSRCVGDMYHKCLMALTKELTVEGKDVTAADSPWMTITRDECWAWVENKIEEISAEYRDGVFKDSALDEYRGARVKEVCKQICWTVIEQVRAGNIKSMLAEAPFSRRGKLPPIEIKLEQGSVLIEGVIDRVDYLGGGGVKIIDYKTSRQIKFNAGETEAGYRLQLMLYLKAACGNGENEAKPAGVFYFKINEPLIENKGSLTEKKLEEKIRSSFKLDGVLVDDPQIIADIAGAFSGFSDVAPLRTSGGNVIGSGKNSLLSSEKFTELQSAVADKVKETCRALAAGDISVHPMKAGRNSACTYCEYKGICMFDTAFAGCAYNVVG